MEAEWKQRITARELMVKELVERAKSYQSSLMVLVSCVCYEMWKQNSS